MSCFLGIVYTIELEGAALYYDHKIIQQFQHSLLFSELTSRIKLLPKLRLIYT